MNQKRSKSPSFDAIIKFFLMRHEIITRKDLQKIIDRLDNIENLLRSSGGQLPKRRIPAVSRQERYDGKSAYQRIYDLFRETGQEFKVNEIRERTGYNDKKVRNLVYRLLKAGKIQRTERGRYGLVS
uniref:Uncharacterized protein n=1 Tax=Desulfatirhabdium butyrativorans TaxID=340467 RepID=A0A7C4MNH2_9BACT